MSSLRSFNFDKMMQNTIDNTIKEVGPIFYKRGANDFADIVSPIASSLLRRGASEGGQLMSIIKKARNL